MKKNTCKKLFVVALAASCLSALPAPGVAVNWRVIADDTNFPTSDTLVAGVVYGDTYFSPAHTPPANPATNDCSAYVNDAMTWLAGAGGGTIYFPPGHYMFTNKLTLQGAVILRGRWAQPGAGQPVTNQTIFDVYYGQGVNPIVGTSDNNAFIYSAQATPDAGVRDLVFWYPIQNPTNWTVYPFTIANMANMKTIENVTLVNSYAGVDHAKACFTSNRHIFGTTLTAGMHLDKAVAMPRFDDINLAPDYWAWSGLSNAPSGTALSTLRTMMLANTNTYGLNVQEMDNAFYKEINISGYCYGLLFNLGLANDANWSEFYNCTITNCTEAVRIEAARGLQFFGGTFAGTANGYGVHYVGKNAGNFYDVDFTQSSISGGLNAFLGEATVPSHYTIGLQSCTLGGTVSVAKNAVLRVIGSTFTNAGNCVLLNSAVQQALIAGCRDKNNSPATVVNSSGGGTVLINTNLVAPVTLPYFPTSYPTTRKPAKTNLFNVFTTYGANTNGTTDATLAISNAIAAASANGGGIVFFPVGEYLVTSALTVSNGVELRGVFGARHENPGSAGTGETGITGSQLNIKANQGSSNGPACFTLLDGCGIRGLNMDYPVQNYATGSQTPYPYMVECKGTNNYVIDCCCGALYQGVDMNGATNALAEYNFFGGLANTYRARGGATDCRIQNAMVKPANWWRRNVPPNTDAADITLAKTINTIIAADCTNLTVQMIFNHVGHTLFTGQGGSGQVLMLGGEELQRGYVMNSGSNNFNFIGCNVNIDNQGDGTGEAAWWLQTNYSGTVRSVSAHVADMACDYIARVDNPNGHIIFDDYFQDQGAATPRVRAAGQVVINNAHLAAEYFTLDVPAGGRFDCSNSILLQMPDMSQAGVLNYGTNNSIIPKSFITSMDHSGDTSQLPCYPFGVAMDTNNLQAAWADLGAGTRDQTVRGITGLVLASGSNFVCHVTDSRFTNAPKQIIEVYYLDGDTTVTGTLLVKYRNTGGTMTTAMTIDPNPGSNPGINSSSKTVTDAQFLGGTNWDIVLTSTGTSPVVCDVIVTANSTIPYLGLPPQLATPPVAQFTGTPTNGTRPLAVTFTDNSTGSITNLLWNFGDSQTTNTIGGAVVSHNYTNAGSYTVSLIASGNAGSNTNVKSSYITVNVPTAPNIGSISVSGGTNLLLTGSGGPTNGTYYYWLRSSTNIALPLTNWSLVATNPFNADGTFSNQIPLTPGIPQTFYRLQMP